MHEPSEAPSRPRRASGRGRVDPPLWEVFVRLPGSLSHVHAGSLPAPDPAGALRSARDLFTRRGEDTSVWVVPSAAITTSAAEGRSQAVPCATRTQGRGDTAGTTGSGASRR